jgi:hypothetical protein
MTARTCSACSRCLRSRTPPSPRSIKTAEKGCLRLGPSRQGREPTRSLPRRSSGNASSARSPKSWPIAKSLAAAVLKLTDEDVVRYAIEKGIRFVHGRRLGPSACLNAHFRSQANEISGLLGRSVLDGTTGHRRAGESRLEPAAEEATAPETLRHPDRSSFNTLESGAAAPADGVRRDLSRGWADTLRPMTEGARRHGACGATSEVCAMTSP